MTFLRLLGLIVLLTIAAGCARAEAIPPRGKIDARVRTVPYVADQVYLLPGRVGYMIHIELEPGETYVGIGAGDSEAINVDAHDEHIFLKPRASDVVTNLILLTNRRRYHFDYQVHGAASEQVQQDAIYSLRFLYPPRPDSESEQVDEMLSEAPANAERPTNFDYWYCGHRALKPVAVTDDGVHTRIRFSERSEMPAIFVRNEDGSESLMNFSIDAGGRDVVIHRVAPAFVLRRGRVIGCIVNRGYIGAGVRLPSGTVAPVVRRAVKGVQR